MYRLCDLCQFRLAAKRCAKDLVFFFAFTKCSVRKQKFVRASIPKYVTLHHENEKKETTAKNHQLSTRAIQYYKIVECSVAKSLCKCCLCPDDAKPINATEAYNLENYLKNVHSILFNGAIAGKVKEPVERLRLLKNIVEIVCVNGCPSN